MFLKGSDLKIGGILYAKIIFIGAGSMAEALIHGWIKKNVINPHALFISNRSNKERLNELVESYDVNLLEDHTHLRDADLVILAMKPKDARAAMEVIAPHLSADTAILSVLVVSALIRLKSISAAAQSLV